MVFQEETKTLFSEWLDKKQMWLIFTDSLAKTEESEQFEKKGEKSFSLVPSVSYQSFIAKKKKIKYKRELLTNK